MHHGKEIRYFSTFRGIGGFDLGIERAALSTGVWSGHSKPCTQDDECRRSRFRRVGFSEIDKYAVQIYQRHLADHVNFGDITCIDAKSVPDFDLYVGGFPCQAFSIAGKGRGFEDIRGTLFFDVARILAAKRPSHFLLENVKGLLSHDNDGADRILVK
jgi:DNA (cytosine-5)-methyltransferase 1